MRLEKSARLALALLLCSGLLFSPTSGRSNYASQGNSVEFPNEGLPDSTVLDRKVTKLDDLSPVIFLNRTKAFLNCAAGYMQVINKSRMTKEIKHKYNLRTRRTRQKEEKINVSENLEMALVRKGGATKIEPILEKIKNSGKLSGNNKIKEFAGELLRETSAAEFVYNCMVASERMEFELQTKIQARVLYTVANPRDIPVPKRLELTDSPSVTLEPRAIEGGPTKKCLALPSSSHSTPHLNSTDEIADLDDSDYWLCLHISRRLMRVILDKVKTISLATESASGETPDPELNALSLRDTILLAVWYLRHSDQPISSMISLFGLSSSQLFDKVLRRGLRLLSYLQEDSGIGYPNEEELMTIADTFRRDYGLSNIGGVIAYEVLVDQQKRRMLFQTIVDGYKQVRLVLVSADTRPYVGLSLELTKHPAYRPSNIKFAGDSQFQKLKQMVVTEEVDGDKRLEGVLSLGRQTLTNIIQRFPRLLSLDQVLSDAPIAASVLHNYCLRHLDLAPLV